MLVNVVFFVVFLLVFILVGLIVFYLVKLVFGINFIDGWSFGLWGWFKSNILN